MSSTPVVTEPSTPTQAPGPGRLLPLLLAGLLAVAGVWGALVMTALGDAAVTSALEAASRGPSSGVSVTAHPDPWFVYSVDGAPVSRISVTASDGSTLPVTMSEHSFTYGPHTEGLQVGSFEVLPGSGLVDYRVVAEPAQEGADVTIAVTTFDVAGQDRLRVASSIGLLVVNLGAAVLIVAWTVRRGRRSREPFPQRV